MTARPPAARALFLEAIRLPPEGWPDFVRDRCGDDPELRGLVEGLLHAHQDAASQAADPGETAGYPAAPDPAGPAAVIGPYRLLEKVGEGGMGAVYVAEQADPVRRRVALKMIKPGMDSREVVARFDQERQALALMDHPGIARVLDAGATPDGRPYFVMELVRGLPVTAYCDHAAMPTADRLRLFALVCRAVQHAHQKGVIHRDLKPSNVMVTVVDGEPVPKVIDFGIAKAVGPALTDKAVYTGLGQMVGTPLYMAPEQAELSGVDVDTRADVYSLGVLLYELLTGTTPFDPAAFRKAGYDEMRRIIREDEPPRPSHRLSTLDAQAATTASAYRGVDRRQLGRLLRGDLDWIVMTALEKDRGRRYESAGAFAADVERFLADQPVQARPPSAGYRLRKFARRNRVTLATTALVLVAVLAVAGGLGWGLWDAAARRRAAEQAVATALDDADNWERLGRWPDGLAAADRALALAGSYDDLRRRSRQRRDDLALVVRLDQVRLAMATVRDGGFDAPLGDRLYAEAFRGYGLDVDALAPEEVSRRLPDGATRLELVAGLDDWMRVRRDVRPAEDKSWERPLAAARAADPDPLRTQIRDAWAARTQGSLKRLADTAPLDRVHPTGVLLLLDRLTAADQVVLLRKAQAGRPGDFWLNHSLARGLVQTDPPQPAEAVAYYRAALALRPDNPGVLLNLGSALTDLGRSDEAAATYERAIRLKPDYAGAMNNLANLRKGQGRVDEAIALYEAALRADPNDAMVLRNLGSTLAETGKPAEGLTQLRKAVALKPDYAVAHVALGDVLFGQGKLDEAVVAYETARRLKPNLAAPLIGLGRTFQRQGKAGEAIAAFGSALRLKPDNEAGIHLDLSELYLERKAWADAGLAALEARRLRPGAAEAECNLGHALQGLGRYRDALAAFRRGHATGAKDPRWRYPSARWVRECEVLGAAADVAGQLSPIFGGQLAAVWRTEGVWRNDPNPLAEDGPMALRTWLRNRSTEAAPKPAPRPRLGVQRLEGREVPSAVFGSALSVGNAEGSSGASGVANDAAGNTYLTGRFTGTVDFDPAHAPADGSDVLTSRGGTDVFVAKYAADGTLAWARRMGGAEATGGNPVPGVPDIGNAVAVDAAGNVYVAGGFTGAADFGPFTLTSAGGRDGFVAKLDSAGVVRWATRWGTAADDVANAVGLDAAGNVYAVSTSWVGSAANGNDVVKLAPTGAVAWDRFVNTHCAMGAGKLAVDAAGNVYVAGEFQGTVDFDPGVKTQWVTGGGGSTGYVLKLTTAGKFAWVSPFVGQTSASAYGYSSANSVAVDGAGGVIVGGYTGGNMPVDFDPGAGTATLPAGSGGYVAKLNAASGGLSWVRGLAGSFTFVLGLAVDAAGGIYATGDFSGTVDFDPGAGVTALTSAGGQDAFVLKLDAAGTFAWAGAFGGTGDDLGTGVAVDGAGGVSVVGSYNGTADFDPDPNVTYNLTTPGTFRNGFLVKLRQN